jgi:hypothetical protein
MLDHEGRYYGALGHALNVQMNIRVGDDAQCTLWFYSVRIEESARMTTLESQILRCARNYNTRRSFFQIYQWFAGALPLLEELSPKPERAFSVRFDRRSY